MCMPFSIPTLWFSILPILSSLGTTAKDSMNSWNMQFPPFVFKEVFESHGGRLLVIEYLFSSKGKIGDDCDKMLPLVLSCLDNIKPASVKEFPKSNVGA